MKIALLLMGLGWAASLAEAQENHFDGTKWREKEDDHFLIRAEGTGYDPVSRLADKVWIVCEDVLPGLTKDFEENEFRTPSGAKGAEEAPFRLTVYLLGDGAEFRHLVGIDAGRHGWDAGYVRLVHTVGNYADPQARYVVLCKGDPMESAGGDRDVSALFAHWTGATLLRGRARSRSLPFWMTAGFGYYVEHKIFDLCRVHYLDFESHYRDKDADFKKGETLGADRDWASVLRKMCKDGKRCSLDTVLGAQVIMLTPEESGYIFALTYFLVRDEPAKANYRKLVAHVREGKSIDSDLLLKTYGYADAAALETEWYEWMESRAFK